MNDEATTRTRTIVVGFPSKYLLSEMPTPNILAIQRALAPARAAALNAFGGLCLKCSICGKDEPATSVCSSVVAYRATNRDLNAVEIGCYGFFGNHRAPVLVDDEHQNKHQTLILSERFICVCNDHHCISEARTKRTQGKKFGQGNDMMFTFRCAVEPIGRVLAHLRGGDEQMRTRIHSASSKENECGNNPVNDAHDGVRAKEMK
jgi:hypothetical protein